jgi:DNA helicase-2/ATP-dependent DNA helicase PcrA
MSASTPYEQPAPASCGTPAPGIQDLLAGLNPQQRAAVVHAGSPLLIVAGAGSGKTRVLTHRIAYLLAHRGVAPGQVLAITFTNKTAAEMRQRVSALVGRRAAVMWVSTFHSMCVRILRREAAKLSGLTSNFSIYDADDTRRLVTMVARDLDLDPKRYPARTLAAKISNQKNDLVGVEAAASAAANDLDRRVAEVYAGYQERLAASNAVDFDDLIMRTVGLLQTLPDVAEHYRRRFRHILVDEYQDTNHAQYVLIRELVGPATAESEAPAELCVVGDADQSIYAFRGATIRNIEEFERDFPTARTILLEQNYRSTQTILSAANAVIARNPGRRDKRLWSAAGDGEPIIGYVADNEHDEAAFVASEIDQLVDSGQARFGEWRCSTGPTIPPGCSRRCSSVSVCPTRWSAGCASTSAGRSVMPWPTCGCWTIPRTPCRCAGSSTRRAGESATAQKRWSPPTLIGNASPSLRRCGLPPPARTSRC